MTSPTPPITRFAPSPTGALHIGHGWSALLAHDVARAQGGQFRLRIEDIDGARSRPEHVAGILHDLDWLGLVPDGPVVMQSERLPLYRAAVERLAGDGLAYPCFCTRADIARQIAASASAPHGPPTADSPDGAPYPGTCAHLSPDERARRIAAGEAHAWRLAMARGAARAGPLAWTDMDRGEIIADALPFGDIVLARKDAPGSYHLCATMDDAAMASHVVRGTDLRPATHVHRLLQALLGLPTPLYRFHGLLLDADGRRLAKRSGGLSLAELRAAGQAPERLVADLRAGRFPVGIHVG
ncbi:tRNA glutamyl-Q(34) synthetase GluQRS [Sphingobium sufflavum]|uniref:tRNA glutamyl-Q(34) synthetase GluQRS n=1 Tax=Sphingobium sufflavum TaxID=1129547 RepID=UPI001F30F637|nr:tRNA glutamyl-Q(34) synthetase GluQRS [Sphingobium sufflavum]MCE7797581.1 tRNA glutamyl-Q(34) synthetase GluQRS [Sphingobium sufflavum]